MLMHTKEFSKELEDLIQYWQSPYLESTIAFPYDTIDISPRDYIFLEQLRVFFVWVLQHSHEAITEIFTAFSTRSFWKLGLARCQLAQGDPLFRPLFLAVYMKRSIGFSVSDIAACVIPARREQRTSRFRHMNLKIGLLDY